jgi:thiol-disulfide isomerase/thioredoxin
MRRRILIALAAVALVGVLVVGLLQAAGGDDASGEGLSLADQRAALAAPDRPLRGLYRRPNAILPGSRATFDRLLDEVRGAPLVVNKWASWCGPCRLEFPIFQRAVARLGSRVGFLGLNALDERAAAERFLASTPVAYPSVEDPEEEVARRIDAAANFPITVFFDRTGKSTYVHVGPYTSYESLAADVRRYAR